MQNGTRTRELLRSCSNRFPIFVQKRFAGGDEFRQLPFGFEFDLQLSNVKVLGVAKLSQQDRVHQLRNALGDFSSVCFLRYLEENDFRWSLRIYEIKEIATAGIIE